MISVCMATYNGEKFILRQLLSILCQLGSNDEIIICDDKSTDNTIDVIKNINDKRIKLFENEFNVGCVSNFEKALSLSKGDIIFLSDQDDVWLGDKVEKCTSILKSNPNLVLLHHGITTVDELENKLDVNYVDLITVNKSTRFSSLISLTIKPKFFGCAICFKRKVLDVVLPFPSTVTAHDQYICNSALLIGKVEYLPDVLIYYRKHGSNLTPQTRRGYLQIFIDRAKLIISTLIVLKRVRCV